VNPDFVKRIKEHDLTESDSNSPLNVINNFYYKPPFRAKRELDYLKSSLLEKIETIDILEILFLQKIGHM